MFGIVTHTMYTLGFRDIFVNERKIIQQISNHKTYWMLLTALISTLFHLLFMMPWRLVNRSLYQITRCHNPGGCNIHSFHYEDLKYRTLSCKSVWGKTQFLINLVI